MEHLEVPESLVRILFRNNLSGTKWADRADV